MDMPRPGEAHARLQKLVGEWSGSETLHPSPWDPAGGTATAQVTNRTALDGFAVVQEYAQFKNGVRNFSGHGLFWWDDTANQYVMTWFDSMMGRPADYRGDFEGDVLRLRNAMPQGGFARCSFDCGTPGAYAFLMEVSPDGEHWTPMMEGRYGAASPARSSAASRKARTRNVKATRAAKAKPARVARKAATRRASAGKTASKRAVAPRGHGRTPKARRRRR